MADDGMNSANDDANYLQPADDEDGGDESGEDQDHDLIIIEERDDDDAPASGEDDDGGEGGEGGGDNGTEGGEADDSMVQDDSSAKFSGHTEPVHTVAICPSNPAIAASGGEDDKAFLWNTTSGAKLFELAGHKDTVTAVRFNHDGKLLATASLDSTVKVWDVATGSLVQTLEGPATGEDEGLEWLDWHCKGNVILAGARDSTCWMWMSSGTCMNVFAGHEAPLGCGGFTPDGKQVVTGCDDGSLRIWDPKTAATIHNIKGHNYHKDAVTCIGFHPSSNLLITGSADNTAKIVNLGGKVVGSLHHEDCVESVAFCASQNLVATASLDKTARIWDSVTTQLRTTCPHDGGVVRVVWHPKQPLIFTCSLDRTVRLWDGRSGKPERTWLGHEQELLDIAVSPAGDFVVSASDDHKAFVFTC